MVRTYASIALTLLVMSMATASVHAAHAAPDWPSRPIRLVVPFAPGGSGDVIARPVAERLTRVLGKQVVVDNRTGAGGTIGIGIVASAPADGYTLLLTSNSLATSAAVQKTSYDPLKDFDAIGRIAAAPLLVVKRPTLAAQTVQELVAFAKANPGKLSYGTAGVGSSQHLVGELFAMSVGNIKVENIHYKGTAPSLIDLMAGRIDFTVTTMASIRGTGGADRITRLAYATEKRVASDPDVPTLREAGFDLVAGQWWGLFGPRGLDAGIRARLNGELAASANDAAFTRILDSLVASPSPSSAQDLQTLLAFEVQRWRTTAERAGVRVQ